MSGDLDIPVLCLLERRLCVHGYMRMGWLYGWVVMHGFGWKGGGLVDVWKSAEMAVVSHLFQRHSNKVPLPFPCVVNNIISLDNNLSAISQDNPKLN